jgi:hypothetical protein
MMISQRLFLSPVIAIHGDGRRRKKTAQSRQAGLGSLVMLPRTTRIEDGLMRQEFCFTAYQPRRPTMAKVMPDHFK